jgi:hypothetical protein
VILIAFITYIFRLLSTEIFILIHFPAKALSLDDLEFAMGLINRALKFDFIYKRYEGKECNAGFISARKTTEENVSQNTCEL